MGDIKYYAMIDEANPRANPMGVARRRTVAGHVIDEAFTGNLAWEPTDYFNLYRLGHNDVDHVEITESEAQSFVEMITKKLGATRRQR